MKAKYVEERFPRWFVFGESEKHCDLSDGEGDVFQGITKETASELVRARDAYVSALCAVFEKDADAFYQCVQRQPRA